MMNPKPVDKTPPDKTPPDLLASEIPTIELRGHTYEGHSEIVPTLLDTMAACGCWLLEQRAPSAATAPVDPVVRPVYRRHHGTRAR